MSITLPHDASLYGHRVDAVLRYLTISTAALFGVLAAVMVVAVLFHRGRQRQALYTHGNGRRDRLLAAAAGLVVLVGIDAVAVVRASDQLRGGFWRFPDQDPRAVRIEVTGQQWAWTFRYPGIDGRFDTSDDIVTLNELRLPLDRPAYLQLTSKDVVHSFYLPNFRNKIDVIPGAVTRMWFQPAELGVFEVACAQHCGAWHYKMRAEVAVMTPDAFARWSLRAAADTALRRNVGAAAAATSTSTSPRAAVPSADGWDWIPRRD